MVCKRTSTLISLITQLIATAVLTLILDAKFHCEDQIDSGQHVVGHLPSWHCSDYVHDDDLDCAILTLHRYLLFVEQSNDRRQLCLCKFLEINIQIVINVEIRSDCKFSRKLNEIKFMKARARRSKFQLGLMHELFEWFYAITVTKIGIHGILDNFSNLQFF